ncbi:hypothetical protein TNCV_5083631 [Trichonephila clavipes]|uniref:Secreted protein n=1 Tax=Trichonephila clavipes TaxID=2585209 RepID=A0A8X6S6Q3_TRICX|nr:hypothetical protein TNCV_5083631 [Trichonephila clavipes]
MTPIAKFFHFSFISFLISIAAPTRRTSQKFNFPNPCTANREVTHVDPSTNAVALTPALPVQQNHCQAPSITGLTAPPCSSPSATHHS